MNTISDDIDYLSFVGLSEYQHIGSTSEFMADVRDRISSGGSRMQGEVLPWKKTFDRVRLRPGEVSLWAGINGHGKSLVLGQVLLWLESKVLIASLEMKPAATLERMVYQGLGGLQPTEKFLDEFEEWTDNMWIYDQQDSIETDRILGMCIYAAKEMGANHIMIDSLMKCGIAPDDYSRQKAFVDRLCWVAKTHDVHIHLVHHIRKKEREGQEPDKFDIKGAGETTDLVDNVFIIHRNKDKEAQVEKCLAQNKPLEQKLQNTHDQRLIVAKQRHGEWEGKINLWHHPSGQFVGGPDSLPLQWRYDRKYPRTA